jgi:hypothetical protein
VLFLAFWILQKLNSLSELDLGLMCGSSWWLAVYKGPCSVKGTDPIHGQVIDVLLSDYFMKTIYDRQMPWLE